MLLIYRSRKPEVYSTGTRKCHPLDLPLLSHLKDAGEHVKVPFETVYRVLGPWSPEASGHIDNPIYPVVLTNPSQILKSGGIRGFDEHVMIDVLLEEPGDLRVLMPGHYAVDTLLS